MMLHVLIFIKIIGGLFNLRYNSKIEAERFLLKLFFIDCMEQFLNSFFKDMQLTSPKSHFLMT